MYAAGIVIFSQDCLYILLHHGGFLAWILWPRIHLKQQNLSCDLVCRLPVNEYLYTPSCDQSRECQYSVSVRISYPINTSVCIIQNRRLISGQNAWRSFDGVRGPPLPFFREKHNFHLSLRKQRGPSIAERGCFIKNHPGSPGWSDHAGHDCHSIKHRVSTSQARLTFGKSSDWMAGSKSVLRLLVIEKLY